MKVGKAFLLIFAALVATGASVGTYYGVRDIIKDNSDSQIPASLFTMFGRDVEVESFSDFSSPLIDYGAEIDNGEAYFYEVHSPSNSYGSIQFALGIEDGIITKYLYVRGIDTAGLGELGDDMAKNNELFLDYSLDNPYDKPDDFAGTTITYSAMEEAVKAALTDSRERSLA